MKLKHIILAAALTAATVAQAGAPKYIFYYIGDGMGMGPVMAAENYNRTVLRNDKPLLMMQFPVVGWCQTWSASSLITDSAAAGTALSTGHKTRNGMLGMDADSTAVTSIASDLKRDGYGVGIVTSVAPDDATPGAFYAHVPYRKMYYDIDCQAAASGYDFLAGAGLNGLKDKDGNPTDVADRMKAADVRVVRGLGELAAARGADKLFLLNYEGTPSGNIGYTIDSLAGRLTLPQMTEACLDHLERVSPDRFFMMVEGGNIDHALHANDGGAAIKEILNFNQALKVAYDFYLKHPDETLIVVTADHDTGGLAVSHPNGNGVSGLKVIDLQRQSKEEFSSYCKSLLRSRNIYTWDDMKQYLGEKFGFFTVIPLSEAQEKSLRDKFDATFEMRNSDDQKTLYANFNAFAVEVFRIFNTIVGLNYTTVGHSGNPVPVFAIGEGADAFKGLNNNVELPVKIMRLVNGD